MSVITEEDLKLDYRTFRSWRENYEPCRFLGKHWSPDNEEMLYIIVNEDWAVGERYYHSCDAFNGLNDPEAYGGNLDWNICNDCITHTDLIDRLDFAHHEIYKDESSAIAGPCDAPPFSDEWHLGARNFTNLVHDRMYELNNYEDQDEWEERVHGSWREQADDFLTQIYKRYGDRIPSGEYTCDACGIVLNDRRRSK